MPALWGLFQEKQQAPDFSGILPSASYAPFEPGHTVADGRRLREGSGRPEEALHPDAGGPPVLLDGRQRTGAADRRRVRHEGHARRLDRQGRRPQRARDRSAIDLARRTAMSWHRGRQRNHLPLREIPSRTCPLPNGNEPRKAREYARGKSAASGCESTARGQKGRSGEWALRKTTSTGL